VETLATLSGQSENLAEVAHDARNMVTALGLYCDLLEEPGVLAAPFAHYGSELRMVAAASRRLVEKLVALDSREAPGAGSSRGVQLSLERQQGNARAGDRLEQVRRWELVAAEPIDSLAGELLANRNLLIALAGPSIALTVDAEVGALPVKLTGEDLTRVLVNLVKNAAEAMPTGGRIQLGLREWPVGPGGPQWLALTIEDSGPGIPCKPVDKIFEAGYSTRATGSSANGGWPAAHRGLGLSISRSVVEAAGGRICAENLHPSGARFEIELPIRTR
jgi:signal transduction histidine kinase